uniref:Ovule protein n=1 Tax=Haemonchus placei TaxID=6290 RepID=A0A0N4W9H9_HAEPC
LTDSTRSGIVHKNLGLPKETERRSIRKGKISKKLLLGGPKSHRHLITKILPTKS